MLFEVVPSLSVTVWLCIVPDTAAWSPRTPPDPLWPPLTDVLLCGRRLCSGRCTRAWRSWNWSTSSTAAWPARTARTRPAAWSRGFTTATRDGTACKSVSPPSCAGSRSLLCRLWGSEAQGTGWGRWNLILRRNLSDFVRWGWQEGCPGLIYTMRIAGLSLLIEKMTFRKTVGSGSTMCMWDSFLFLLFSFHIKHFIGQREEFETARDSILVWLTEMDLQLTNIEHFSECDVQAKIKQLKVIH